MNATDMVLRSSAVLIVGLIAHALLARRSAALRHCVLAVTIFSSAAVVPLSLFLPSWDVRLPAWSRGGSRVTSAVTVATIATTVDSASVPRGVDVETIITVGWAAGFVFMALLLVVEGWRLVRISARAQQVCRRPWISLAEQIGESYDLRRRVALLQTDAADLLATWGLWRPLVLLPSHAGNWSDERMRIVLSHELAHIRRNDWFIQIAAETVRTMFWFNPLVWIACTRLRRESEQACDDVVLGAEIPAREYAEHLLEIARKCRNPRAAWISATPMARSSTLERRIAAMLNPGLNRRTVSRSSAISTIALLLAVTLPTAAFRAAQTSPATLTGSVYDPTGAVVPGVTLTLENAQEQKQQATSRADGRFDFPQVAPGKYVLSASLPGFRSLKQEFELKSARDWDRAITLQVGELQETISVRERRVTGPVGASQPQGAQRLRVGGNIKVPTKTLDVKPTYPKSMRDAGREGLVPIEAIIGTDGTVTSVRVLTAQVHPDFAIAAVDAVRQWKFTPTLLNGAPVEVVMKVSIQFGLSD
ncbi:MAG TPA: M56 family metallopeptidase [Vicinamibacterales bacterium]|nr:M56 family metallopeptidase [Vicinamibacterales bacterium]